VTISARLLAHRAGISERQTRRALRRLIGANLVEVAEPGRGTRPTKYRIKWKLRGFPQPSAASSPTPLSQGRQKEAPPETTAPPRGAAWSEFPIKSKSSALRWAMFHLRREIQRWGLPPPRRENLLRGLGAALWRLLRRGALNSTAALRRLVSELLHLLRDAREGVSRSLKLACSWAGWAVATSLRALSLSPRPRSDGRNTAEALRQRLEELRRRYVMPWISPEERARIAWEGRKLREELELLSGDRVISALEGDNGGSEARKC